MSRRRIAVRCSRKNHEQPGRGVDRCGSDPQKIAAGRRHRACALPRGSLFRPPAVLPLISDGVCILARYSPRLFRHRDDPSPGGRNVGICHPTAARIRDPNVPRNGAALFAGVFRLAGLVCLGAPGGRSTRQDPATEESLPQCFIF